MRRASSGANRLLPFLWKEIRRYARNNGVRSFFKRGIHRAKSTRWGRGPHSADSVRNDGIGFFPQPAETRFFRCLPAILRHVPCAAMALALAGAAMGCPEICRAQESSTAAGATAGQTPAEAAPKDATEKPAAPPKTKHVITNEDLEPRAGAGDDSGGGKITIGDNSSLLSCEVSCEQKARNQLGFGPDDEAEWRAQIVKARRDLIEDFSWRQLLGQYIQRSDSYCHFQLQQSQQISSHRSDYRSQVQYARNAQYYENMDRTLRQGLEAISNRIRDHIQEVQELSPVRAGLMVVQAARISERPCEMPKR